MDGACRDRAPNLGHLSIQGRSSHRTSGEALTAPTAPLHADALNARYRVLKTAVLAPSTPLPHLSVRDPVRLAIGKGRVR